MVNTETIYRSPPNGYETMNIFNLVINFIQCPKTCSKEVVNSIKTTLNVVGRNITFFTKQTSELAGIKSQFVDNIPNNLSIIHDPITIIVSPPTIGELSNNPFWHRFEISKDGSIKHIFPFK